MNVFLKLLNNRYFNRIKKSERFYHLVKGTFWLFLGMGISRVLLLLAMIIVARILGSEKYGEFGMIRSTINTFTVFASFSIGLTANKFVAEYKNSDEKKASRIIGLSLFFSLCLGCIFSILIFIFSKQIASHILKSPDMAFYISIAAIMILFSALNGAYSGIFSGLEAFKKIAQLNIITGSFALIILITGAYFWNLEGVIIAFAVNLFTITLFSHFFLTNELKKLNIKITFNKSIFEERKVIIMFSLPLTLAGILVSPTQWISNALVFGMPNGKVAIGIFTACLSIQMLIIFVGNNLNAPLLSLLSREKMDIKMERVNMLSSWVVGIFVAFPFLSFPEIAEAMFGEEFKSAQFRITLILVMLSSIIVMYKQGFHRIFMVNNDVWIAFYSNLVWASILIVSIYYLRRYGSVGLALSYFISYIINLFIIIPILLKKKMILRNTLFSKSAIAIWICLLGICSLQLFHISVFFRIILSGLILLVILFAVKDLLNLKKN